MDGKLLRGNEERENYLMKRKGAENIFHGLFLTIRCALYKTDFEMKGGLKMGIFLGMVVEQINKSIKIHLDKHVNIATSRKHKGANRIGVAFKAEDAPELPYQLKQKHFCTFVAKLQFAATWI